MNSEFKKLTTNISYLGIVQIINYLVPIYSFQIVARTLGAYNYGNIAFAVSIVNILLMIQEFGFSLSTIKRTSEQQKNLVFVNQLYSSVILSKLIFAVTIFLILAPISYIYIITDHYNLIILFAIQLFPSAFINNWIFQAYEQMKYLVYINMIGKSIGALLIILFINGKDDIIIYALIKNIEISLIACSYFYFIRKRIFLKISKQRINDIFSVLKSSYQYFISRVSVNVYTNGNIIFLGLIKDSKIVGYYALAEKLFTLMISMLEPLTNALYPMMCRTKNKVFYKKVILTINIILIPCVIILNYYSAEIIVLLFGVDYTGSIKIFKIFIMVFFISAQSVLIGYPLLGALGYDKLVNRSVINASISHIMLLVLLYWYLPDAIYLTYLVLFTQSLVFIFRVIPVFKHKILL